MTYGHVFLLIFTLYSAQGQLFFGSADHISHTLETATNDAEVGKSGNARVHSGETRK